MFLFTAGQAFKYSYLFLKIVFLVLWKFEKIGRSQFPFENRGGVVKCRAGAFLRLEESQREGAVLLLIEGPEGCVLSGVPSI